MSVDSLVYAAELRTGSVDVARIECSYPDAAVAPSTAGNKTSQ